MSVVVAALEANALASPAEKNPLAVESLSNRVMSALLAILGSSLAANVTPLAFKGSELEQVNRESAQLLMGLALSYPYRAPRSATVMSMCGQSSDEVIVVPPV